MKPWKDKKKKNNQDPDPEEPPAASATEKDGALSQSLSQKGISLHILESFLNNGFSTKVDLFARDRNLLTILSESSPLYKVQGSTK